MYNHQEYIKQHRRLEPEELIGRSFILTENGNHGMSMCKGYRYMLKAYNPGKIYPYTFDSDWGKDTEYSVTETTFKQMRLI